MTAHTVTLETFDKYPDPNGRQQWPGERAIVVDGVRWGHTIAKSHGRRGVSYTFKQDHDEVLIDNPNVKHVRDLRVRKADRVVATGSIEKMFANAVLAKAIELVVAGRLRDPAIVLAERNQRRATFETERAAAAAGREKEFRDKATDVLSGVGIRTGTVTHDVVVARIVEAMRWAQTQ